MNYGIEPARPGPQEPCLGIETAAQQFGVSRDELERYAREGLLIPLKSASGATFTERDYRWIATIKRLRQEARLSFEDIRQLLARCSCWKLRHCDFHSKQSCPLTKDLTKPCWMNRAMLSVLCSYPCYSCIVYRSAPDCEGIGAVLKASASGNWMAYGYYGG